MKKVKNGVCCEELEPLRDNSTVVVFPTPGKKRSGLMARPKEG